MQSAKWLQAIRRLAPLWVGLWLLSSFGGPASAWQHLDGTLCPTCTLTAPVADDDCERESPDEISLSAPDDCQKCCAQSSQRAPEKVLWHVSPAAILSASIVFDAPARRETRLKTAFSAQPLDTLPRPPPRGRAPPVSFSISPFCRSEI